jgi:hypothetical protein
MPDTDIIRIDSKAARKRVDDAERVPIFELDGVVYDIPVVERADLALEYMGRVEEVGLEAAQAWMIRTTVGEAGFQALRDTVGLSGDDWQGILDRIQKVVAPKARTTRA